jgi:hypothetical protein
MNNEIQNSQNQNNSPASASTVEVLYQKMGDRWFAFSLVGEEVFVGSITQDEIDALESHGKLTPKAMPEA